jgi:hypothetical protein
MTATTYRALLSVPITADNDAQAHTIADEYAASLKDRRGFGIVGHNEYVISPDGEIVHEDPSFRQMHGIPS